MDEQLTPLILKVQQCTCSPEQRRNAVTELVDEILRSRKICRPLNRQPLTGIYWTIYQQVREQLRQTLEQDINQYNLSSPRVRDWISIQRDRAFKTVLTDESLKQLALDAQQHPPSSEARNHALRELVQAIGLSGKLSRPHLGQFSPEFYALIYDEAVNQTLMYICQHIDNYDPNRGKRQQFMNWVNFRLNKQILDSYRDFQNSQFQTVSSLADLENIPQPEAAIPVSDQIADWIRDDADNQFKRHYIRNRPDANFQAIALATLAGKSWEQIATEFGISASTLSSFFYRCCHKFAPKFQHYLSN